MKAIEVYFSLVRWQTFDSFVKFLKLYTKLFHSSFFQILISYSQDKYLVGCVILFLHDFSEVFSQGLDLCVKSF